MLDFLFQSMSWSQLQAIEQTKNAFKALSALNFKGFFAFIMVFFETLGFILFNIPMTPAGAPLDLSGYELVFEDEFEGDSLDMTKWVHRGQGAAAGGYFADSQVFVKDGNMILRGEYREDGKYGPGWYAGMVKTYEDYKFGYFEMRCIANADDQFWSAFWLQSNYSYKPEISKGGVGGAEIDIFEAMSYGDGRLRENGIIQTIHCSGMEGVAPGSNGLNSQRVGHFKGNNIYSEYNTYGLEWNEDEYIFYINGVETRRTSYGDGTSKIPEQVIASICLPQEITHEKDFVTDFLVDYVRIYQKSA